jgi:hypothetical protein
MYKKLVLALDFITYSIGFISLMELMDIVYKWVPIIVALIVGAFAAWSHRSTAMKNKKESALLEEKIKEQVLRNEKLQEQKKTSHEDN